MVETIITCAITGNHTTRENHPDLPVSPAEIADACIKAARAGASIVHIHVRDPATGEPSMDIALYREVVDRIRSSRCGVLINLTTGPGARYIPSKENPQLGAPGSSLMSPEKRIAHVVELKPDICSLDMNTMFSNGSAVINTPDDVTAMAAAIYAASVKPEIEIFDTGDIHLARDLHRKGTLKDTLLFQLVLGVRYGAAADADILRYMRSLLPVNAAWGAFGIGRAEFPILAQSYLMGGNVRVGFEDNVFLQRGELAPDNAALVEKAVRIVRDLGGTIATPQDARRILQL